MGLLVGQQQSEYDVEQEMQSLCVTLFDRKLWVFLLFLTILGSNNVYLAH